MLYNVGKIVAILLVFVLVTSSGTSYGFDYINTYINYGGFTHTPIVCLVDPPEKYKAIKATKAWEVAMRKEVGQLYDYNIRIVSANETGCDILVQFINPLIGYKGASSDLGLANCYKPVTGDRFCSLYINPEKRFWLEAVTHEVGHAFGLGHRLPLDNANLDAVAGIILEDDIMYPQASPFDHITIEDLDALQHMYNKKGWTGGINQTYIIPHDGELDIIYTDPDDITIELN